jgi:hypothetical protein
VEKGLAGFKGKANHIFPGGGLLVNDGRRHLNFGTAMGHCRTKQAKYYHTVKWVGRRYVELNEMLENAREDQLRLRLVCKVEDHNQKMEQHIMELEALENTRQYRRSLTSKVLVLTSNRNKLQSSLNHAIEITASKRCETSGISGQHCHS